MPASVIKSFAKKSGKSEEQVEKIWKKTKDDVEKQFKYKTGAYWAYVNSVVQKKLGISESMKFKEFYLLSEKTDILVGDSVKLLKPIKGIEASVGELFTVMDVASNGDLKIANSFGPEHQDTYFSKKYFEKAENLSQEDN